MEYQDNSPALNMEGQTTPPASAISPMSPPIIEVTDTVDLNLTSSKTGRTPAPQIDTLLTHVPSQSGPIAPIAQGSITPIDPIVELGHFEPPLKPLMANQQRTRPRFIPSRPTTPSKLAAQDLQAHGSGKLPTARNTPDSQNSSTNKNSGSGKLPVGYPVGVPAPDVPAASAVIASPPGNSPPTSASIPAAMAIAGMPGGQRQVGLTPLPVPVTQRRRRSRSRRRWLLFVLLALLTLLVIGGVVVSALGGPNGFVR